VNHVRSLVSRGQEKEERIDEKKEGRGKKERCDILEAFAMLGALAWQATVIKRCFFGVLGGDRTGVGFFGPGFSSLCVCPLCLLPLVTCSSRDNSGTLFQTLLRKELQRKHQRYRLILTRSSYAKFKFLINFF
jgi:hypothetical protein